MSRLKRPMDKAEQKALEEALELMPRGVRDKLDRVGIKLHLAEWEQLTMTEREQLRARARLLGDASRRRDNLEAELATVEAQLAGLKQTGIKPALHEQYKMITDPSAYRRRINEKIAANNEDRLEELEQRRLEIIEALHTQDMSP